MRLFAIVVNILFVVHQFDIFHRHHCNHGIGKQPLSNLMTSGSEDSVPHVIVVGAGVGGLATSIRLASSGVRVTLLDKNSEVGGRCGSFDVNVKNVGTFRHERGPSLLLLPDIYREVFRECNKKMEDYDLTMAPCVPAYQVIFDDGDRIELGFPEDNLETRRLAKQSMSKMDSFEANGAVKWHQYMNACEAFLDCGLPNFIEEKFDIPSFPAFLRESLREGGKAWPLKPHSAVLNSFFVSDKMKALASFQDLYVGLQPYELDSKPFGGVLDTTAPAIFGLLAAIELHQTNKKGGVFAPIGGFRSVTNALMKLAKDLNVTFINETFVTSVNDKGVHYVDNNGHPNFLGSDAVVINADLPYAAKTLLDGEEPIERIDWDDRYRFSSGVIAFHWSVNKELSDLNTHNVFLSAKTGEEAKRSWDVLFEEIASPWNFQEDAPFNFYVHRPTKTDPTASPQSYDVLMILVPCPSLKLKQELAFLPRSEAILNYSECFNKEVLEKVRSAVLKRMAAVPSLDNLSKHIIHETVDTPGTYMDQYNVGAGTPFGISHGFAQLSLMRPGHQCKQFPNVWYVGASTRPGNGVPLVLVGAKLVSKKILSALQLMK